VPSVSQQKYQTHHTGGDSHTLTASQYKTGDIMLLVFSIATTTLHQVLQSHRRRLPQLTIRRARPVESVHQPQWLTRAAQRQKFDHSCLSSCKHCNATPRRIAMAGFCGFITARLPVIVVVLPYLPA
jgi:hypothetical protein